MTDPTTRELITDLLAALKSWSPTGGGPLEGAEEQYEAALIAKAEAFLAQPEPEGPTDEPLGDLIDKWVQEAFRKKPYGCKHPTHTYVACKAFEHGRNHAARTALAQPEPDEPPELIRALELAEAALADIGDAEREPGDDLAWAEARAAQDLPRIRAVLARWGRPSIEPVPVSERPWEREGWCDGDGWCWCFDADGTDPWWSFDKPEGCPTWTHLLPHDALPLPVPTQHS